MHRHSKWFVVPLVMMASAAGARAEDAFDFYTNPILAKAAKFDGAKEIKQLTPDMIAENDQVLPNLTGGFLVVHTHGDRWAKLLVQSAFRKFADDNIPILLVQRYVTFKEDDERTVRAEGKNLNLFDGYRLNLSIGQIVPENVEADIRFVSKDGKTYLEPVGKAQMFLLSKAMPEAEPKKIDKLKIGETFQPEYFAGKYKLYDDGRRSGTLELKVDDKGSVEGFYYSDLDGQKYEVFGKVGREKHTILFVVKFPRTEQTFSGFMFTGDGKAMTGSSKMQAKEAGFYALRVD